MHPEIKDSWTPAPDVPPRDLPPLLAALEGGGHFGNARILSNSRLSAVSNYWLFLLERALSACFLTLLLDLWDVASARWNLFPLVAACTSFSLFFHSFYLLNECTAPFFPRLFLGSFDDVHYCFSNTHGLACHSFSAQTDCKRCHILCCEVVPDDSSTPNVFF